MKLIVGLGNPGDKYQDLSATWALTSRCLARQEGLKLPTKKNFCADFTIWRVDGGASNKPYTFKNHRVKLSCLLCPIIILALTVCGGL